MLIKKCQDCPQVLKDMTETYYGGYMTKRINCYYVSVQLNQAINSFTSAWYPGETVQEAILEATMHHPEYKNAYLVTAVCEGSWVSFLNDMKRNKYE